MYYDLICNRHLKLKITLRVSLFNPPLGVPLKGRDKFRGKFPDAEEADSLYSLPSTGLEQ